MAFIFTPLAAHSLIYFNSNSAHSRLPLACASQHPTPPHIAVCLGPTCNGKFLLTSLNAISNLPKDQIQPTGCLGECGDGPNVAIQTFDAPKTMIWKHVINAERIANLLKTFNVTANQEVLRAVQEKEKGDQFVLAGDDKQATPYYTRALHILESNKESTSEKLVTLRVAILCNCAQAFVNTSAYKQALEQLNDAIELRPGCASAWKWKAKAHEGIREIDMAKKAWDIWGRLSGKTKQAEKQINQISGWKAWFKR